MLDHVSIGVRDLARSKRFYDSALLPLGYTCISADDSSLGYGREAVGFWVGRASTPVAADAGSNLHFCFRAPDRSSVDAFHAAALQSGGSDNGAPGLREAYGSGYYAAFAVDPDGYRIEAFCDLTPAAAAGR